MLLSFFKVKGHSMEPVFKEGSFLVASSVPLLFAQSKVGDIILFDSEGKTILKKIVKFENGKYFVEGENKLDDKKSPPVPRSKILGKVIIQL